jgi:hypothetical protein
LVISQGLAWVLIPLSSGRTEPIELANERIITKEFGECRKCYTNMYTRSSWQLLSPRLFRVSYFCSHASWFPLFYFSYLSTKHMRVTICHPVYFCHLQNETGSWEKVETEVSLCSVRTSLDWIILGCPVIPLHHNFQGCGREGEASNCHKEHQLITHLGIKGKLQTHHSISQRVKDRHLLYLSPYNRI